MIQLNLNDFSAYLAPRPRDFHKGQAGHVLIVGGASGYEGAVTLTALAALRTGAGRVSVAMQQTTSSVHYQPEVMYHAVHARHMLAPLIANVSVIAMGPGLGQSEWSHNLFQVVNECNLPIVIDADGLNRLAQLSEKMQRKNWVLTPHPGEAARLLQTSVDTIQADRVAAVKQLQTRYGGIVVLKGAGTLIADEKEIAVCSFGNPGMASGGMGDALTGVIAALIAQQLPLLMAARLGVLVHALAGDRAAQAGERGMIASDVIAHLRELVNPIF